MLVGVDYFSTMAYLPSLAVDAAGPFAPVAAAAVVLVTFLCALPIYGYLVGRAPDGRGAAGILEQAIPGWRGKLCVLALLGFAAADFVITRSLSLADAAVHLLQNEHARQFLEFVPQRILRPETLQSTWLGRVVKTCCEPQVAITLFLTVASYLCWQFLRRGLTLRFLQFTAFSVVSYLLLSGVVILSGAFYIVRRPAIYTTWYDSAFEDDRALEEATDLAPTDPDVDIPTPRFAKRPGEPWVVWLSRIILLWGPILLWTFPQMALGFSGFELVMAITPVIKGESLKAPCAAARAANTRKLMLAAALIMAFYLVSSVTVTAMLAPAKELASGGMACHRALAYFAHGNRLADGSSGVALNPFFGPWFGDIYDCSTVLILCLAGAAVTMSLRSLLPHYLHRLGMEVRWAGEVGAIVSLLTLAVMLVTIVFRASPSAQQWAYATSVCALLSTAAFAAGYDILKRKTWRPDRLLLSALAFFTAFFFVLMLAAMIMINQSGLAIAMVFVCTIFISSFISRWIRSTELRFEGFDYVNESSRARWEHLATSGRMVLVPHRPGNVTLAQRKSMLVKEYWLDPTLPVVFVQAHVGDPSNFYQKPLMAIVVEEGFEVIRLTQCVSISHVLAAICVQLSLKGEPPVIVFGWSRESPLKANMNFFLLGEGNIPWMVKELVHHAIPDPARAPRILVG